MRILSLKTLRAYWENHPDAKEALRRWYKLALAADWASLADTRATFPHADEVKLDSGAVCTVFNIGGNKHRLVVSVHYPWRRVYVLAVMTHAQYTKDRWKKQL